ncbi:hypothetical protein NXS98_02910 [Fontisphaera persica]|uniref:hypothetical protein n=1 Tax=Fontisphaera persica TaxID=2974023 RepID=UPI0024BFCB8F|nr:hypothetical protein [Fontisphaera persica]WCJ60092.1 hypothetical protein NXS98_02910 [Fontisphaera persica]
MQHETFEERLRRQPWRPLPQEWRAEIMAAAQTATTPPSSRPARVQGWRLVLDYLLWPSPRAWAGVAALWLVAVAGNIVQHWASPAPKAALPVSASTTHETLPQRQQVLAEWLNAPEAVPAAAIPAPAPPRGDLRATNRMG